MKFQPAFPGLSCKDSSMLFLKIHINSARQTTAIPWRMNGKNVIPVFFYNISSNSARQFEEISNEFPNSMVNHPA